MFIVKNLKRNRNNPFINGKEKFTRIIIKHKGETK
jgi:hypothetical protein